MYEEKSAPAVSCNLSQRSVACHMNAADQRGDENKKVLSLSGLIFFLADLFLS